MQMANDFAGLTAAIDNVASEISEAVAILTSPHVDNNDQAVIDSLTAKLSAAALALQGALPADPAVPPADGSGSGDVTP
jgi:hypothetical protein